MGNIPGDTWKNDKTHFYPFSPSLPVHICTHCVSNVFK